MQMNTVENVRIDRQKVNLIIKKDSKNYDNMVKEIRRGNISGIEKSLSSSNEILSKIAFDLDEHKENIVKAGLLEVESILSDARTGENLVEAFRILDVSKILLKGNSFPENALSPKSKQLNFDYVNRRIDLMTYKEYCEEAYNTLRNLLKKNN